MKLEYDTATRILTAKLSQSEMDALNAADIPTESEQVKRGRAIKHLIYDERLLIEQSCGYGVEVKIILANPLV